MGRYLHCRGGYRTSQQRRENDRQLLWAQQDNTVYSRGPGISSFDGGHGLQTLVQSMRTKGQVFSHVLLCQKCQVLVVDKTQADMVSVDMV